MIALNASQDVSTYLVALPRVAHAAIGKSIVISAGSLSFRNALELFGVGLGVSFLTPNGTANVDEDFAEPREELRNRVHSITPRACSG